jgi:hypothetical protein
MLSTGPTSINIEKWSFVLTRSVDLVFFHFVLRKVEILQDTHIDYRFSGNAFMSMKVETWNHLCSWECFYEYEGRDLDSLIKVLKSGKTDQCGHMYI